MTAHENTTPKGGVKRGPRRGLRHHLSAYGFAAPAIVLTVVLLYLPFLWTAYLSFTSFNGFGDPEWVGPENYVKMFQDEGITNSMLNTLFWVIGTLVIPVGLGLVIALLSHGIKGGVWYRMPFLVPYAVSGIAVGVIWTFILESGGALDEALNFLHLPGSGSRWLLDSPSTPS